MFQPPGSWCLGRKRPACALWAGGSLARCEPRKAGLADGRRVGELALGASELRHASAGEPRAQGEAQARVDGEFSWAKFHARKQMLGDLEYFLKLQCHCDFF